MRAQNELDSLSSSSAEAAISQLKPQHNQALVSPPNSILWESLRTRFDRRVLVVMLCFLSAVAGLASPFFQKIFVDRMLGAVSMIHGRLGLAWLDEIDPLVVIFLAFACTLTASALGLLAGYWAFLEGVILQERLSKRIYQKMISLKTESMSGTTVGEIVSIYATDVPGSTAIIDQAIPMAGTILFPLIFSPIAIRFICGIPLTATIIVMTVIISFNIFLARRQARFFLTFKQLAAERTGIVNEWVQNIRLLRILGWIEKFEAKIFKKREEETVNRVRMVTNGQLMGAFGSSISFVINLVGVASLVLVRGGDLKPGELFALLWIFGVFLARAFRSIPWIFTFSMDSLTSIKRIERFLARVSDPDVTSEIEIAVPMAPTALNVKGLNLSIGGLSLLKDVSFSIKPGEFVAIVGEVGSGKSLLLFSLVGETGATFDQFEIGTEDSRSWSLNERRRRFALVSQEGFVMSASLRENILFRYDVGTDHDTDIIEALELAQFRLNGELLSDGLNTEIGERGVNLSGGQRQRVALARAHALERPVLLLDDCLSAVDVDTERLLIQKLISGAWKNRTRLLVTHRLSVLEDVDRILFMKDGRIADSGTFDELFARSPEMRDFVASVKRTEGGLNHVESRKAQATTLS